ncbi:MAG: ATP-binding protein [Bacteroidales bacterium]|nr:ATP-binding protein [Bacteroidales bacterium]MDD4217672.1 ATP-binding protein [Bacteroidales bacterium]MDY0142952.1 ATP-binding protein [Bacteroidales bacterium]
MSGIIVGRINEKQVLSDALYSYRSELIAVYGRRRVGKTYLVREFFGDKIVFSFTGLSTGKRHDQINNFMLKLNEVTSDFKNEKQPVDWLEAFSLLKKFLKGIKVSTKKKVLFIDEFPWVDSHKSGFLAAFENFWNDYCTTRRDLVVVVCGSAASYMVKKIINNSKGLSKRITQIIKLYPFTLYETQAFLKFKGILMEKHEILKIYMVLGGVAEYLEHVKKGESAVIAIDRLCFQKGSYLENEYDEVFKSLFDKHSFHQRIVNALASNKRKGITRDEILLELNISSGGRFSDSLEDLIQSGFVLKYDAYKDNTKSTLYRIYDEFCLFHLKFMSTYKGTKWAHVFQKQEYKTWCGHAFETICLKHSEEIKKALKCDQIESKNYSWHNSNSQIDLVIDRADDVVNLCEIKFYNNEFSIDAAYLNKLRKKESQFRTSTSTKKGIYTVMITTWGLNSNQYSQAIVTNSLTMDCLFEQ